ncbi:MAG: hypothetical protein KME67_10790 [Candidatus Thiodiazotropha sp. (ex Codakia orbicularis)]|nr:hypothetical protein [Candidatus Thiodiazotropha sp. (ex Codakia orbicularis)]
MAMNVRKAKGRREGGVFVAFPCSIMSHPNFIRLSPKGIKLLMDFCSQLRMKKGGPVNNGDLTAAWVIMEKREWTSKASLYEAINELLHYGWIILTRQGCSHRPSLYGLTFYAINDCDGKLDVKETVAQPGDWRSEKERWVPKRKTQRAVQILNRSGTNIVPKQVEKCAIQ